MEWFDEVTTKDASSRSKKELSVNGVFWAEYIKQHKSSPTQRYEIAIQFLPLPAAFREAVLALRAIIKEKKSKGEDFIDYLNALYRLAVWRSFCIDYADKAQMPGYSVFESIPGGKIINLDADYQSIGYEKLKLISKTDIKLLVDIYGEPEQHTTLNSMYRDVWDDFELKIIKERESSLRFL
jgi:hypothetical protein